MLHKEKKNNNNNKVGNNTYIKVVFTKTMIYVC